MRMYIGSDLDGDEFSVFWHPMVMFAHNEPAMQFPSPKAAEPMSKGAMPSDEQMAQFFVDFLSQVRAC